MQKQNLQDSEKVNLLPSTHGEGEALTHIVGASPLCPKCKRHIIQNQCGCGYERELPSNGSNKSGKGVRRKKLLRRAEYLYLGDERKLCGCRGVLFICKNQLHPSGKRAYCGRGWCKRCGLDDSDMHKRRYVRLMDKVFYLGDKGKNHGLGYFVFTIPSQVREQFERKSKLSRAGRGIREILKKHGFDEGISMWHSFGEDEKLYHPHINCLVVGRFIPDKELADIREEWRRLLEDISGESIDVVDFHYHYHKAKGQWWHKAKYITRSTFKALEGNESLAEKLFRFKNLVYWGFGQGDKRAEKLKRGRVVLRLWLEDVKKGKEKEEGSNPFYVMSLKEYDELVSMSHLHCIKCMEQGHGLVGIEALVIDGYRKMESMQALKPYIERECKGGYFLLVDEVISNIEANLLSVGITEQDKDAYDDS